MKLYHAVIKLSNFNRKNKTVILRGLVVVVVLDSGVINGVAIKMLPPPPSGLFKTLSDIFGYASYASSSARDQPSA